VNFGLRLVDDLEELREVGLRVRFHLGLGEARTRLVAAAGIADERGVGADDEDHLVAQLLELPELSEPDGVPQVDVGRRGIEPLLHAERGLRRERALQLLHQLGLGNQLLDARADDRELARRLGAQDRFVVHGRRTLATLPRARKSRLTPRRTEPSVRFVPALGPRAKDLP
jgi:hypothetical protein